MQQQYIERVVDLTEPEANQIYRLSVEEAREIVLNGSAEAVGRIAGSFALVARAGKTVKMARSLEMCIRDRYTSEWERSPEGTAEKS